MKKNKLIHPLLIVIMVMLMLSGCTQKEEKSNPSPAQMQTQQKAEEIPEQLTEIERAIESVFKDLNGPASALAQEEDKKSSPMQENKGKNEQETPSPSPQQDQGNAKQSEETPQGEDAKGSDPSSQSKKGSEEKKQPSPKPPTQEEATKKIEESQWKSIASSINQLHYQWNDYLPNAAKAGASKTLIDNFSNALNKLTVNINEKNNQNTLLAASSLYAYIPDFYQLYKVKFSQEIKRIRHYIRNALLSGTTSNWVQAEGDINNLKALWSIYKSTLSGSQQESINKLEMSLMEFEKVVQQKNIQLTDIKGRVTLSNIDALEKSLEEESKK